MKALGIGVVGCGNISDIYLTNLASFEATEVMCVADLDADRARAEAEQHHVRACSVDEMLVDPAVDLVLNLTVPKAHFEVAKRALEAGKHAYNEKPLALTRDEGRELVQLAASRNLQLGGAPDTFLGAGLQTCRKLIDGGAIGTVVAGQAFMMCHGHESWHPSPEFYYEKGGGPLFDMGPYYIAALVSLIGPVAGVTAVARQTFPTRTITSEPKRGKLVQVEVLTHVVGILEFAKGAVIEMTMSFDVWHHTMPPITLHGSDGSLQAGDPNAFGDQILVRGKSDGEWASVPLAHAYAQNSRGLGVLDIALALRDGRPSRAGADLQFHVLDVMQSILESAAVGKRREIRSTVAPIEPMPESGLS